MYFDNRWNVFAKICTVSVKRVYMKEQGRKFVQRNFCVYGSWVKTVPTFHCSSHSKVEKKSNNIENLIEIGPCVQGIVTDNHSASVNMFPALIEITL